MPRTRQEFRIVSHTTPKSQITQYLLSMYLVLTSGLSDTWRSLLWVQRRGCRQWLGRSKRSSSPASRILPAKCRRFHEATSSPLAPAYCITRQSKHHTCQQWRSMRRAANCKFVGRITRKVKDGFSRHFLEARGLETGSSQLDSAADLIQNFCSFCLIEVGSCCFITRGLHSPILSSTLRLA